MPESNRVPGWYCSFSHYFELTIRGKDGDGKADYVFIDPNTGNLTCWLNRSPGPWESKGVIAAPKVDIDPDGSEIGSMIFVADVNGDGRVDCMPILPRIPNSLHFIQAIFAPNGAHANITPIRPRSRPPYC